MSDSERINRLRAKAAHIKAEGEHHHHAEGERDAHDGARAAMADMDRILDGIEKRLDAKGFAALKAEKGAGKHVYVLPNDFKSNARGLKYSRVFDNSPAFIKAYVAEVKKQLGEPFFVNGGVNHGDGYLHIGWPPDIRSGDGH